MGGWVGGCVSGWIDGCMHACIDGCTHSEEHSPPPPTHTHTLAGAHPPPPPPFTHMSVRACTCKHTRTHTHTHKHTHSRSHARTHARTHTQTHTHTLVRAHPPPPTTTTTYTYEAGGGGGGRGFRLLPGLYSALDSFLFRTLFAPVNTAALHLHSIQASCIPALNVDGNLHHEGLALVLEAKLRSSNVTRALRQFPTQYLFGDSGVIHVSKPSQSLRP